jgi:hypothetical protein
VVEWEVVEWEVVVFVFGSRSGKYLGLAGPTGRSWLYWRCHRAAQYLT